MWKKKKKWAWRDPQILMDVAEYNASTKQQNELLFNQLLSYHASKLYVKSATSALISRQTS
jgi:hypothetical protein